MARKLKTESRRPAMVITAGRRKTIDGLADKLAEIAPATTMGKGFCVKHVAQDMSLAECWVDKGNKRKRIAELLANVIRRYPRKPKKLVLAIIEGGVQWRAKRKGRAVLPEELAAIADDMGALGFDIRRELKDIDLPDPSRVVPPSLDLAAVLDRLDLHESLKDDCAEMFRNGHLNEAVRKALERFEKKIQKVTCDHKAIGKDLMGRAFTRNSPLIPINDGKTGNDGSEQEGFMHLTMGAMAGMRNLYSHGDVQTMTPMDAFERLCFVSLLFKRVDAALASHSKKAGGAS
jgi:uncharacterized protein (TIGR02391 family)